MRSTQTNAAPLDSGSPIPGYFDSPWPAECGGPRLRRRAVGQARPRRESTAAAAQPCQRPVERHDGPRAPGEVYLQYNDHITDPEKYGQVEFIDPVSLAPVRRSPRLSTGGHTWCTGLVAHENGYLYLTNGNRCFKLDPDCSVVAETVLPQDSAYNSLLVAADAPADHEEHRAGPGPHHLVLVVLDPDKLDEACPETPVSENSMGRIAMDTTGRRAAARLRAGQPSLLPVRLRPGRRDADLGPGLAAAVPDGTR